MATTFTFPEVKAALITEIKAENLAAVDISYAWQPWGQSDQIFLGLVEGTSDIPTIKSGRKHRQESYTVEVICRAVDLAGTPYTADVTEGRCRDLASAVNDVLADDPQIDGVVAIQWALIGDFTSTLVPIGDGKGWGCEMVASIEVEARLT